MLMVNKHNERFNNNNNKCKGIIHDIIQCFNSNTPNHTKKVDKIPNNSETKDDPNNSNPDTKDDPNNSKANNSKANNSEAKDDPNNSKTKDYPNNNKIIKI